MVEPGSYVIVEEQLAQEEDWGHFRRSNVDALDASAEQLSTKPDDGHSFHESAIGYRDSNSGRRQAAGLGEGDA